MRNHNLPHFLKLCRMGRSLYLTVPAEYARAHSLSPHDDVYWQPEPDGIKLKFCTSREPSSPATCEATP